MAQEVARGWLQSPTGCWHHGTVFAAVKGLRTDCGIRAEQTWGPYLDSRYPREGQQLCRRCEKHWSREAD